MSPSVWVAGIDCATDDAKIGVAFGCVADDKLSISRASTCSIETTARKMVTEWCRDVPRPVLLAIDAPLGWPRSMGQVLSQHRAGAAISIDGNSLFRRETDRFIKKTLNKTPLDVGADRIARTALCALRLLADLSKDLGNDLPLAWGPSLSASVSVVEVYPAATLISYGFPSSGYKKPIQAQKRVEILERLAAVVTLPADTSAMEQNADALDATICLLAAHDFLRGSAMPPEDPELAKVEGWIWARRRSTMQHPA